MRKKHYEAIAKILRYYITYEAPINAPSKHTLQVLRGVNYSKCIAQDISDYMQEENPCFDRERFFKACGIE